MFPGAGVDFGNIVRHCGIQNFVFMRPEWHYRVWWGGILLNAVDSDDWVWASPMIEMGNHSGCSSAATYSTPRSIQSQAFVPDWNG